MSESQKMEKEHPSDEGHAELERDIERSERLALLDAAVNGAGNPMLILSVREGHAEPAIAFANPAFIALTGRAAAAVVGASLSAIVAGREPHGAPIATLCEKLAQGEGVAGEFRDRRPDGTEAIVVFRATPLDYRKGPASYVVVVCEDLTAQRSLEAQFLQAQRMDDVGRLAGGVAHDFNNLLTVILSECELLLASAQTLDGALANSLEEVRKATQRATLLTRQLLTFSQRQLVEPTTLSLNEVVSDVEKMLQRLIGEDLKLQLRLSPSIRFTTADRGQLEQVIVNLVVNGRDAMPKGGTLGIETANVELDQQYADTHPDVQPGSYVMLAVSDTGTGMTDDVKEHLFEPFYSTKARGKGTGLGLSTCYSIVRQFAGHIELQSTVGIGTTVRVYLPSVHASAPGPARPAAAALHGGSETVLLVEDDVQVRRIAVRVLVGGGYRVLQAADGEEALQVFERSVEEVDLVLSDVVLPKMGGRTLAERMRRLRPKVPVLFMSGYSDDVVLQDWLLEHDIALLQKPFTTVGLLTKVRDTLDRSAREKQGFQGRGFVQQGVPTAPH